MLTGERIQRSPGSIQRKEQRKGSASSHINGGIVSEFNFHRYSGLVLLSPNLLSFEFFSFNPSFSLLPSCQLLTESEKQRMKKLEELNKIMESIRWDTSALYNQALWYCVKLNELFFFFGEHYSFMYSFNNVVSLYWI